jgi:hypothetical protein
MSCEELRDEYELYALGISDDAERAELERHLQSGCPNCSTGVKRALALNAWMMQLPADVEPPRNLRKRVLGSVGVETKNWGLISAWAAVIAGLLAAVFWLGVQDRDRAAGLAQARQQLLNSQAELSQVRQALVMLNEPETRQVVFGEGKPQPPRGRVFVNARRGVLLFASNLPQPAAGKTYELWVIPKSGAPTPAGLFQSDAAGNALYLSRVPVDIQQTGAVAVTLEPAAGSPGPTSTPVIVAPVAE